VLGESWVVRDQPELWQGHNWFHLSREFRSGISELGVPRTSTYEVTTILKVRPFRIWSIEYYQCIVFNICEFCIEEFLRHHVIWSSPMKTSSELFSTCLGLSLKVNEFESIELSFTVPGWITMEIIMRVG